MPSSVAVSITSQASCVRCVLEEWLFSIVIPDRNFFIATMMVSVQPVTTMKAAKGKMTQKAISGKVADI